METSGDLDVLDQRGKIFALQRELLKFAQIEPRTEHYFCNGMYLRTVWSPAGSVIVGAVHRTEHFYAVLTGRVRVTTDGGLLELDATRDGPQILTCPAGTKRAVFVLEDAWRMNVHRNPENIRNIQELEAELVESDETSAFEPGNLLKADRNLEIGS